MLRAAAVAAVVMMVGCSSSEPRDCSFGTVLDEHVAGAALDDCGNLYDDGVTPIDTMAWMNAQTCVLDHVSRQSAFRVEWGAQGIEGDYHDAYIGMVQDTAWTLSVFGQSPNASAQQQPTRWTSCSDLHAITPCNDVRSSLCIQCIGPGAAEQCAP